MNTFLIMSIFLKSFLDTIKKKNWYWIGGVPGVLTAISCLQSFVKLTWWQNLLVLGCTFAAIFILFYGYYFLRNAYGWIHNVTVESIWGEVVKVLADVYAQIHEIEREETITEKDVADVLGTFCNKVKQLFDKKTNSDCCVSIKLPISHYSDSGEWQSIQVRNVSRDQKHISDRDTQDYKNSNHDIIGNTAYSYVISMVVKDSSKPKVYLENNVKDVANYLTTSCRQTIPYESELVVPIIPSRYKKISDIYFGGFLCVDSNKRNAFDAEHYDIPMTVGLADGLYSIMLKLLELNKNKQ